MSSWVAKTPEARARSVSQVGARRSGLFPENVARTLSDARESAEYPTVDGCQGKPFAASQLNDEGIVDGDSGFDGAEEGPLPKRLARDGVDAEAGRQVQPVRSLVG